jgi:hypothetical protein
MAAPRLVGGDSLRTRDDFYGPQIGLSASTGWKRFTLEGHVATALGVTVSELGFAHSNVLSVNPTGNVLTTTAGLVSLGVPPATAATLAPAVLAAGNSQIPLTQAATSNTLTYFGVVGEGGVRVSYRATDHVRLTAGYGFLYWNNVRRAEEMFLNGPVLRPRAIEFTTHLFSLGLDVRY